ncbi:MAG TPA: hypothetical protein DEO68_10920 [Halomonas campaniensis]|uniref:DUF7673 domain-containing protein n=2 Tax=Halomonas TaxID=2745 RepID=A0A3D0KHI8_9GAMM|nr:hypothetical protein [Halomonas colorata]HCA02671.1 hypothetical protein [Halomonas campaniensis]
MQLDRPTRHALERVIAIAQTDTGQGRICASFLLAWHNPDDNGGFGLTDLWGLDDDTASDCRLLFDWISRYPVYPDELGYGDDMTILWRCWRDQ